MERNGGLEVEVVQARGLTMKSGSKGPPGKFLAFVKNKNRNQNKLRKNTAGLVDLFYRAKLIHTGGIWIEIVLE